MSVRERRRKRAITIPTARLPRCSMQSPSYFSLYTQSSQSCVVDAGEGLLPADALLLLRRATVQLLRQGAPVAAVWPMVLLDSPKWLATIQLLLAVFNIIFLISVLPSQRKGNLLEQMIEDNREADIEEAKEQTMPTEEEVKNCPPNQTTRST